jgi:hypothetical protein
MAEEKEISQKKKVSLLENAYKKHGNIANRNKRNALKEKESLKTIAEQ